MKASLGYYLFAYMKCPKCNTEMVRTSKPLTSKRMKQPYYFLKWDICKNCKHVQHYEKYKVFNKPTPEQDGFF